MYPQIQISHEEIENITAERLRKLSTQRVGPEEQNFYDEDVLMMLNDDDMLSNNEQGFMDGYLNSK